jgi:hypothetical protein
MSLIAYRSFRGEIPVAEPHLLPDTAARLAQNCEFVSGSLSPLKDGVLLRAMASSPVKGIYTDDGLLFYTWPVETIAFASPVFDDVHRRVYYLSPSVGTLYVTTRDAMAINGPTPSSSVYQVGVPTPTTAPLLQTVERDTLKDHPSAAALIYAWYELGGEAYQKTGTPVTTLTLSALRQYSFASPARATETPADAKLVCRFVFADAANDDAEIVSMTLRQGEKSRSLSLPGGIEAALEMVGSFGQVTLTWGIAETRSYVYNFQNLWDEEGPPSPAALVPVTYVQDVRITTYMVSFGSMRGWKQTNIYRTYGANASYIQTTATSPSANVYLDQGGSTASMGKVLESFDWDAPPTGLQGLELMPNGWMIAFKGDTAYLSEPYRPHAFGYSMKFRTTIRGVRAGQQSAVVTTADGVSLIVGASPKAAQPMTLQTPQAGTAQRGMTNVDGGVAYVSNDGLVLVDGAAASTQMSQRLFGREKWRELFGDSLADASLRLDYHDGYLVGASNERATGFVLKTQEDVGTFARLDVRRDSMFRLPVTDSLYYSVGSNVYRFAAGAALTFDWWGKDFILPTPGVMRVGYIRCDGPTRLTIYADDVAVFDQSGLTTGDFRMPEIMPIARRWSVRLRGSSAVHELLLAQTKSEMRRA